MLHETFHYPTLDSLRAAAAEAKADLPLQEDVSPLFRPLPLGTLDINLYRDDWTSLEGKPHIGQSRITAPVDNAEIILIDDVLFSGRTIRAALEALLDYGRPRKVELLVPPRTAHPGRLHRPQRGHPPAGAGGRPAGRTGRTGRSPADRQELT